MKACLERRRFQQAQAVNEVEIVALTKVTGRDLKEHFQQRHGQWQ
jgi:hypothetical protein